MAESRLLTIACRLRTAFTKGVLHEVVPIHHTNSPLLCEKGLETPWCEGLVMAHFFITHSVAITGHCFASERIYLLCLQTKRHGSLQGSTNDIELASMVNNISRSIDQSINGHGWFVIDGGLGEMSK